MATLKQSTTYTRMFLLVQTSDHVTGLTGATPTVTLSKAGGTFAAAGGTVTEVSSGWYKIALTTTDTNTLGDLAFHVTAASADPTDFVDQVTANILGDTLPTNVTSINSVSTSGVTTIGANVGTTQPINFTGTGASAYVRTDLIDIAGSAVSTSSAQLGVNVVNWKGSAAPAMTGDAYARLGAPAGASVSADIAAVKAVDDAVKAKTDSLTFTSPGVVDATTTNTPDVNVTNWKGATAPAMTGDAYARLGAPAGLSVSADIAALTSDVTGLNNITAGDVWDVTLASHLTAGTTGNALNAAGSAGDPWSTALPGAYGAGTAGKIIGDNLNATVSSRSTLAAGDVWDVAIASHLTAGSTGESLNSAGGAGDPWVTSIPGSYIAGQAGYIVGNLLDAAVSSRLPTSSISLSGGAVTVGTNNDKTGYSLTAAYDASKTAAQAGDQMNLVNVPNATAITAIQNGLATTSGLSALQTHGDSSWLTATGFSVAGDPMTLTSGERNSIADAFLGRNVSGGSSTGRTVQQALHFLRNKWAVSGGTLTVYDIDDTTASWTATVGTDATADPIVSNDPA